MFLLNPDVWPEGFVQWAQPKRRRKLPFCVLKVTVSYQQQKIDVVVSVFMIFLSLQFVAQPNCQQLLATLWYDGFPGWRRRHWAVKLVTCFIIGLLFPVFSLVWREEVGMWEGSKLRRGKRGKMEREGGKDLRMKRGGVRGRKWLRRARREVKKEKIKRIKQREEGVNREEKTDIKEGGN